MGKRWASAKRSMQSSFDSRPKRGGKYSLYSEATSAADELESTGWNRRTEPSQSKSSSQSAIILCVLAVIALGLIAATTLYYSVSHSKEKKFEQALKGIGFGHMIDFDTVRLMVPTPFKTSVPEFQLEISSQLNGTWMRIGTLKVPPFKSDGSNPTIGVIIPPSNFFEVVPPPFKLCNTEMKVKLTGAMIVDPTTTKSFTAQFDEPSKTIFLCGEASVTFENDYDTVVGNESDQFLEECSQKLNYMVGPDFPVPNPLECYKVSPGSIEVVLKGISTTLTKNVTEVLKKNGLKLPSFGVLTPLGGLPSAEPTQAWVSTYIVNEGYAGMNGNDLTCGAYDSQYAIEHYCDSMPSCLGYSYTQWDGWWCGKTTSEVGEPVTGAVWYQKNKAASEWPAQSENKLEENPPQTTKAAAQDLH